MSELGFDEFNLAEEMGDLWGIVLDLLTFYHECCSYCMPYDEGVVWLSEEHDIIEELMELVEIVCEVNGHPLPAEMIDDWDQFSKEVRKAIDSEPGICPNCGVEWNSEAAIGGDWLVARGSETQTATYLLTKVYWTYLTHYTRPNEEFSGLDMLLKIAYERKIVGSRRFNLDSRKVVAFTECSPLEVMELLKVQREFSGIKGRKPFQWKRSEHGVAILRDAAVDGGALPALYGDDELAKCLPFNQRFRFVRFEKKTAGSNVDWTFEREFRIEGDLDLDSFAAHEVALIVKDRREMLRVLARKDVVPYGVIPFDYVFSTDEARPRLTERQRAVDVSARERKYVPLASDSTVDDQGGQQTMEFD